MTPIPKGMPCRKDCPDRQPGCFCGKKKEWDAAQDAKKQVILEEKKRNNMILGVRNPERVRREKNK